MWHRIGMGLSLGVLAACSSAMLEPAQSNARVLGMVELQMGDVGTSGLKAQAISPDLAPGLSIQAVTTGGFRKKWTMLAPAALASCAGLSPTSSRSRTTGQPMLTT